MPTFEYQDASAANAGVIDAPDRAAAVRGLRQQGITPISIRQRGEKESGAAVKAKLASVSRRRAMNRAETASFVKELSTAVRAGLPIVQSLRTIRKQVRAEQKRRMLDHLLERVEHGHSLADACESWGKPFTALIVGLIRAGESSGRLGEVLDQAATLLDRDLKLRRSIMAATTYPMILVALVTGAVIIVVTIIVPRVLEPLSGQMSAADLPLPTRIVQGVADFFAGYWWVALLAVAAILYGASRALQNPQIRLRVDQSLLRIPVLGRLLLDVAVARFSRTMATLVNAGLPALSALRATTPTLGNTALEQSVEEICERVSSGATIADPMEESGYFPPLLVQLVGMGETTGRLGETLEQAAQAFEDRTETSVKLFTAALPPVLVSLLAVVVGFVIAAVILPLLEMQEYIG